MQPSVHSAYPGDLMDGVIPSKWDKSTKGSLLSQVFGGKRQILGPVGGTWRKARFSSLQHYAPSQHAVTHADVENRALCHVTSAAPGDSEQDVPLQVAYLFRSSIK